MLGERLCREMVMHELVTLQEDPVFKVRRELVLRLLKVSRVIGDGFFIGVVMPMYKKLSAD